MRGGREETRQTAAKKSEEQGGKRKEVRETGAKKESTVEEGEAEGEKRAKQPLKKRSARRQKKRGTEDSREKLEHGRRMRGGREEMHQTAAKKSEVQGGKRKEVRETAAKS